jgi:hypothetical protein
MYESESEELESTQTKTLSIYIITTEPSYNVEEQRWSYTHNDLIADVGGYLGLLLGGSILSYYKVMISNWQYWRKMKQRKERVQHTTVAQL